MPSGSKASFVEGIFTMSLYVLLLGPVCFAGAGVWIIWGSYIGPSMRSEAAQDWVETPCVIEEIKVHWSRSTRGRTKRYYDMRGVYRYKREEQVYHSSQIDFYGGGNGAFQDEDEKYVAEHPVGTRTVCYVDPDDPQSAVLLRQRSVGPGLALVATVFFTASIVLGRVMYSVPTWPKKESKLQRTASWRAKKEEERRQREERRKEPHAKDRSHWPKRRKRKHRDKD